ncbi:hypothetical protein N9L68_00270 [bacterium]|nr:hypothetical protein [bacterium]
MKTQDASAVLSVPAPGGGSGLGGATVAGDMVEHLRAVDMCEMFSPLWWVQKQPSTGSRQDMPWTSPQEAEEYIDRQTPLVLMGNPLAWLLVSCRHSSQRAGGRRSNSHNGVLHIRFMCRLCKKQIDGGRLFIHENPAQAKSSALPCVMKMSREAGDEHRPGGSMHVRAEDVGRPQVAARTGQATDQVLYELERAGARAQPQM